MQVRAFINLVGSLVQSGAALPRADPHAPTAGSINIEVLRTMRDAGIIRALAQALRLVNSEHPAAPGAINAILKPLEVLTRSAVLKAMAPSAIAATAGAAQAGATTAGTAAAEGQVPGAATGGQLAGGGGGATAQQATATGSGAEAAHRRGRQGGRATAGDTAMDESDQAEAGPAALAAAQHFLPGGDLPPSVFNQLMESLADAIEDDIDAAEAEAEEDDDDDDDIDGSSNDDMDEDMVEHDGEGGEVSVVGVQGLGF